MIIFCDKSTLSQCEINYIKQQVLTLKKWEVFEVTNELPSIEELDYTKIYRNSFFITRGNRKILCRFPNGYFFPIITIKISDNENWNLNELEIDVKIKRINDFFDRKFIVLFGDERTYNNYFRNYMSAPNPKLIRSFIEYDETYSIDTNILFRIDDFFGNFRKPKPKYENAKTYTSKVFAMGRYYPITQFRKGTDLYTTKILKGKTAKPASKIFYKELVDSFINLNGNYEYVFYVPTRPNKSDRFIDINNDNGLEIKKTYSEIKQLSKQAKIDNMMGCFDLKSGFDVSNKEILLVDDVITDGATLTVISDLLFKKGAKSITWLTFAFTHHAENNNFYFCPLCNNYLNYRFSDKDGKWFLGCSNYPDCKYTYHNFQLPDYDYIYRA